MTTTGNDPADQQAPLTPPALFIAASDVGNHLGRAGHRACARSHAELPHPRTPLTSDTDSSRKRPKLSTKPAAALADFGCGRAATFDMVPETADEARLWRARLLSVA